jgi:hypothetical protein
LSISLTGDGTALADEPVTLNNRQTKVEDLAADIVKEDIGVVWESGLEVLLKVGALQGISEVSRRWRGQHNCQRGGLNTPAFHPDMDARSCGSSPRLNGPPTL